MLDWALENFDIIDFFVFLIGGVGFPKMNF